jgi:hypothetical protein
METGEQKIESKLPNVNWSDNPVAETGILKLIDLV